ncbi:contact-dependent growth inhibition system immunity protein [Notoacmeibacter sp. MSK16QG-6]|uniref:contact-dependent growth inhibition system immunity protein n=1 Tax=Notoacmeibacter sp. MSK16QG-6 TaxID=2957982 RepID=UPI0020A0FB39|nr:contact-dependent growth inhibition system immunity protein [Notoacmeibacter sp. MSK16QG-6]MCP1200868.1 contact-dependent growth inhibition system immunity protein [Notoacmeibacter sp. MSK16QG-6]
MSRIDQFYDRNTRRPPERRAAVFSFSAFHRVHSWACFGMATLDPDDLDEILSAELGARELGAAAWTALRASRYLEDGVEVRRVWEALKTDPSKRIFEEMKKRAGVRSIKALFRGSASVDLIWTEGTIELQPHRHIRGDRWALFKNRVTIKFSETVSEEELGTALLSELEVSRNGSYEGI